MSKIRDQARAARKAGRSLAALSGIARSALLHDLAAALRDPPIIAGLIAANAEDLALAHAALERNEIDPARYKRLALDADKLGSVADGLAQLADAMRIVTRR